MEINEERELELLSRVSCSWKDELVSMMTMPSSAD